MRRRGSAGLVFKSSISQSTPKAFTKAPQDLKYSYCSMCECNFVSERVVLLCVVLCTKLRWWCWQVSLDNDNASLSTRNRRHLPTTYKAHLNRTVRTDVHTCPGPGGR